MSTASTAHAVPERRIDPLQAGSYAAIGLIVAVFAYFAFSTDGFFAADNLRSILSQSAYVGVFALATAIIMISGNLFSLSLSTTGAVTATTFLALLPQGVWPAIIVTVLLGAAIFGLQGLLVGAFGANPIIVSIGAGGLQEGLFLWWTHGGTTVPPVGSTDWQFLNERIDLPVIGALPLAVFILFGLVIVLEIVMRRTRFGRALYLVGENRVAAHAAGLPTGWIIVGAFLLAGLCVGLVGVELGAFNGSGSLLVGSTFTYDGVAAAVVGGVAITGGRGRPWQALAGAIFIQAVSDLLLLRGYTQGAQIFVKGLIVIVTVLLMWLIQGRSTR
jgi:ribose/xylose/arabinose/galactoside ABC-type transport system permease subunit